MEGAVVHAVGQLGRLKRLLGPGRGVLVESASLHSVFITSFIEVCFTDHKTQLFKVYNSVVLVTLLGGGRPLHQSFRASG